MLILVGASASGKTEIARRLIRTYGFEKFVTHTTRPKRIGETNHLDYHFVSLEEFNRLEASSFFIETTNYNGYKYGTSHAEIGPNKVLIVDPSGANKLINRYKDKVTIFFIQTPKELRKERMIKRKDHIKDIEKRLTHDETIFERNKLLRIDHVITNTDTHLSTLTKQVNDLYKIDVSK